MGATTETADYTIGFDAERRLITIHSTGFWDRPLQARFGTEFLAELRRIADLGEPFGVLADATEFPVQSIPISLGFMDIVKRADKNLHVPTAVLTKSVLLRLQALRVFVAPHIRTFGDADAAYEWLAEAVPAHWAQR